MNKIDISKAIENDIHQKIDDTIEFKLESPAYKNDFQDILCFVYGITKCTIDLHKCIDDPDESVSLETIAKSYNASTDIDYEFDKTKALSEYFKTDFIKLIDEIKSIVFNESPLNAFADDLDKFNIKSHVVLNDNGNFQIWLYLDEYYIGEAYYKYAINHYKWDIRYDLASEAGYKLLSNTDSAILLSKMLQTVEQLRKEH